MFRICWGNLTNKLKHLNHAQSWKIHVLSYSHAGEGLDLLCKVALTFFVIPTCMQSLQSLSVGYNHKINDIRTADLDLGNGS